MFLPSRHTKSTLMMLNCDVAELNTTSRLRATLRNARIVSRNCGNRFRRLICSRFVKISSVLIRNAGFYLWLSAVQFNAATIGGNKRKRCSIFLLRSFGAICRVAVCTFANLLLPNSIKKLLPVTDFRFPSVTCLTALNNPFFHQLLRFTRWRMVH